MRRLILAWVGMSALVIAMAGPAAAKGEHPHAKVTVSGAGLPGGMVTLGDDGGTFAFSSSLWERKWDVPNIGGSLEPGVDLGPAYIVRVVLDCAAAKRSRYRQTLYPDAPGGPQLYTPDGVEACGAPAPAGYDPVGPALRMLLGSHGIEFHAGRIDRVAAATSSDDGRGDRKLAIIGVPAAIALLAAGEIVRRRRRR
jgi:hypothetical protein